MLAAEVHALVLAFDMAYVIQDMLHEILGRKIEIDAYVDSKTLFDVVAKDGNTSEKRLQIDIYALRESYDKGELSRLNWIPGNINPADGLTKTILNDKNPLWTLINTNKLKLEAQGWVTTSTRLTHKPESLEC